MLLLADKPKTVNKLISSKGKNISKCIINMDKITPPHIPGDIRKHYHLLCLLQNEVINTQ